MPLRYFTSTEQAHTTSWKQEPSHVSTQEILSSRIQTPQFQKTKVTGGVLKEHVKEKIPMSALGMIVIQDKIRCQWRT